MYPEKYRVRCGYHQYDTGLTLYEGTAKKAAWMHSLLPCNQVEVIDKNGKQVEWRDDETSGQPARTV